jgi:iron(III) transport system substrate-binding protein
MPRTKPCRPNGKRGNAMKVLGCALSVLLALVAASCGGSGGTGGSESQSLDDVNAAIAGLDAQAREAKLVELAKAEDGDLVWWFTGMTAEKAEVILAAFKDTYGIEVTGRDSDSAEIVTRVTEEAGADVSTVDVLILSDLNVRSLEDAGLLGAYTRGPGSVIPEEAVHGYWMGARTNFETVVWNTDLVKPEDAPTRWEDLADPRWKGQLAIPASGSDWYATLLAYWVANGRSEEEAQALFEQIARNAVFVSGRTNLGQQLAAGDFSIEMNSTSIIDGLAHKGAPVTWEPPVEPVLVNFTGPALPTAPQHPAKAVLFVDWLLSQAGQDVLAANDVTPSSIVPSLDFEYTTLDTDEYVANLDSWEDRYDRLVSLGTTIEAPQ